MKYDEALRLEKNKRWQICEPITVDNITGGEAVPPDSVKKFFKMFDTRNVWTTEKHSPKKYRWIDFSVADTVCWCSTGKLIPRKQLSLGLTLKSITESKKVLTLMNRYGHFVSSATAQRVDMSLEPNLNNSDSFIPGGIKSKPNLLTDNSLG